MERGNAGKWSNFVDFVLYLSNNNKILSIITQLGSGVLFFIFWWSVSGLASLCPLSLGQIRGNHIMFFFVSAEFWTWKVMVLNSRHWSLVNTLGSWSGASLLLMILEEVSWNVLLLQNLQKFDHRDCGNFCLNPCLMLIFQCDYLLFPATYNLFCGMRGN